MADLGATDGGDERAAEPLFPPRHRLVAPPNASGFALDLSHVISTSN